MRSRARVVRGAGTRRRAARGWSSPASTNASASTSSGSTRPSVTSPARARARCTSSAHTRSSRCRGTGPVVSRSTASSRPRTWRSVPAYLCGRRVGPVGAGATAGPPGAHALERAVRRSAATRAVQTHRAQLHERDAGPGRRAPAPTAAAPPSRPGRPVVVVGPGVRVTGDRPGHHPPDVRVDHRMPLAVRERRHRPRRVRPRPPAAPAAASRSAGHPPVVPFDEGHRAGVQPHRPAGVAEPPPHPDRLGRRVGGQRGRRRPAGHPGIARPGSPVPPASAGASPR